METKIIMLIRRAVFTYTKNKNKNKTQHSKFHKQLLLMDSNIGKRTPIGKFIFCSYVKKKNSFPTYLSI